MSMKKILIDTSSKAKSLNFFILIFFLTTLIIPFVIINFLENSLVAVFLTSNTYIILLLILFNIIFLFLGCYYSQLKIDSYIINIYSSRFNNKNNLVLNSGEDPFGLHAWNDSNYTFTQVVDL